MPLRVVCLSIGLCLAMLSSAAAAQERDYEGLIGEAVSEFSRGNFVEARALFLLAHEARPNARTFRGLGFVEFELREYVRAVEYLEASLTDSRNALTDAQRQGVDRLLRRARRFVGTFTLKVEPAEATLNVDGVDVASTDGGTLALNAGNHALLIEAEGYDSHKATLTVRGGEHKMMQVSLTALSESAEGDEAPQTQASSAPGAAATTDDSGGSVPTSSLVAFAVGAAGLATFGVFGGMALAKDSKLQDCSPTCLQSEADKESTYAAVADVGLAVGLVGAAIGTWLWLSDDGEDASAQRRGQVRALLAPGVVGLHGELQF